MPPQILNTYEAFQSQLRIRNQIGTTLGTLHQHRCSIPQGCPFSMTLIALLMRPWLLQMRNASVVPRILADDLFMYASRMKHASALIKGMQMSRQYFHDVGARVADNKCFVTSTCPETRRRLKAIDWPTLKHEAPPTTNHLTPQHQPDIPNSPPSMDDLVASSTAIGSTRLVLAESSAHSTNTGKTPTTPTIDTTTTITVVNHFRDLGAHLCFAHTNHAPTLGRRIRQAIKWTHRLRWLPLTHKQRVHTIRTLILPAALYGSEVGQVTTKDLRGLQTAIASVIGPASARRSLALTFELCAHDGEVDPASHLLNRKLVLLYRITHKYPSTVTKVAAIISAYQLKHHRGTTTWLGLPGEDTHSHNFGPISHLLVALHAAGATISNTLTIHQANEIEQPLRHLPWQLVRRLGLQMAQRARYNTAYPTRSHTSTTPHLDHQVLQAALRALPPQQQRIIRYLGSGAAWCQGMMADIDDQVSPNCQLCGQAEPTIAHGLWCCPFVKAKAQAIRTAQLAAAAEDPTPQAQPTRTTISLATCLPPSSSPEKARPPHLADAPVGSSPGIASTGNVGEGGEHPQPPTEAGMSRPSVDAYQPKESTEATRPWDHHSRFPAPMRRMALMEWFDLHPNDLPLSMQLGLAPAMHAGLTGTYWGTPYSALATSTGKGKALLGALDDDDCTRKGRERRDDDAQVQATFADQDLTALTARQAFANLRGPHQSPAKLQPPHPCHEHPPPEPNTYTDGSLTHPTQIDYNLGGAGVWHPGRTLADKNASEAEAQLGEFQQREAGLQLFTNLPGLTTSSTRVELAAAILAIAQDGAVHMGTDSQALQTKAAYVHTLIAQGRPPQNALGPFTRMGISGTSTMPMQQQKASTASDSPR